MYAKTKTITRFMLEGTDLKKMTFCSPAEIEGSKMFPRTHKIDVFKNRDKCA